MNYKVYQGTELKQTVTSKTAVMNGLQPNQTYEFGVQPDNGQPSGDATRDGTKETISVTTRGIRFNIPKTLTVGSTITLRYEEYPLGIVRIGQEPSGMFGGGNKQNLSAKVISTANGSSVVEVAGNVIEVGGINYLRDSDKSISGWVQDLGTIPNEVLNSLAGKTITISVDTEWSDFQYSNNKQNRLGFELAASGSDGNSYWLGDWKGPETPSGKERVSTTFMLPANVTFNINNNGLNGYVSINGTGRVSHAKIEQASIATPYASFVDGDTFTAQPDGTFALFSEYKALYY